MSIHISSDDVSTGTLYNGSINLDKTLFGNFSIDLQTVDTGSIPWMWNGCKALRIISYDGLDTENVTVNFDYATIGSSENTTAIADSFETTINTAMNGLLAGFARTVSVTYTSDAITGNNYYTFTFDQEVTMEYSYSGSTVKYVFGKSEDEKDTEFIVYSKYMTIDPKFIECYIDESPSEYNTSRGTFPTLLWSTKDSSLLGQEIEFVDETNTLTISLYRTNVPISPCPLPNKWDLIFSLI